MEAFLSVYLQSIRVGGLKAGNLSDSQLAMAMMIQGLHPAKCASFVSEGCFSQGSFHHGSARAVTIKTLRVVAAQYSRLSSPKTCRSASDFMLPVVSTLRTPS